MNEQLELIKKLQIPLISYSFAEFCPVVRVRDNITNMSEMFKSGFYSCPRCFHNQTTSHGDICDTCKKHQMKYCPPVL